MTGYRVLVVDDAQEVHEVAGTYLELSGYRVDHANTGREALDLLEGSEPDLVLLDIQMPVMDGFEVLEAMRTGERWQDLPVLILSSLDRANLKVRALEAGADDYIVKPFDRAELLARVGRALRRSDRYRRLASTLRGDLAQISVAEILQTLDLGKKSGLLRLIDTGHEVEVRSGRYIRAASHGLTGRQALQRLLMVQQGPFEVELANEEQEVPAEAPSLGRVLLDALVNIDEAERALAALPAPAALIDVTPEGVEKLPGVLHDALPTRLFDLILRTPGDLPDAVATLADALSSGWLQLVTNGTTEGDTNR